MPDSLVQRREMGSVSRRRFLAAGSLSVVGLTMAEPALARERSGERSVILILLNGGASHLDTFDVKPQAPREVRGPQRPIATSIPGVQFAESLPQLAQRAHLLTVIRSLHHHAAPIHETGLQLLQTGKLVHSSERPLSIAAELSTGAPPGSNLPPAIELGGPLRDTGTSVYRADAAQTPPIAVAPVQFDHWSHPLRAAVDFEAQPADTRDRYGASRFGRLLWSAGCLVACGVRMVTVHTFASLVGEPTWDAHASGARSPATVFTYRDELVPRFDRAAAALLDDLTESGLLDQTLVVCTGEMGRTPRINDRGGRDHWPHVWSGFLAGGGAARGNVIGSSDAHGESVADAPVPLGTLAQTMREALRLPAADIQPSTAIV